MKLQLSRPAIRLSSWTIAIIFTAIVIPNAHADTIVEITISNLTFNGLSVCGPSGTATCTESLSGTLTEDETTGVVTSKTTVTSGDLGTFTFSTTIEPALPPVTFLDYASPFGDQMDDGIDGQPPIPGTYAESGLATLECLSATCSNDFGAAYGTTVGAVSGTTTVSAVPEPDTGLLMLMGIGFVLVMRNRISASHRSIQYLSHRKQYPDTEQRQGQGTWLGRDHGRGLVSNLYCSIRET